MFKEQLEQLFEYIPQHIPSENIIESKKDYQKSTGQIYEDDKSYNMRMALFLEWYLLDNYVARTKVTILEDIIEKNASVWNHNRLEVCRNITSNIQALFKVKKVRNDSVTVLNLIADEKYLVEQEDSSLIFRKNDIFQGRIVPQQNKWFFTGHFCFHPNEAYKYISSEAKEIFAVQKSWRRELNNIEKELIETEKSSLKISNHIVKMKRTIEGTDIESKKDMLVEKLSSLRGNRKKLETSTHQKNSAIAHLKNEKIKFEGRRMIVDLVNKLSHMKLKWERSRKITIADIYKN